MDCGTSVKVAVRIRPLSPEESQDDGTECINTVPGEPQIIAGSDAFFTFDNVFGVDSTQAEIYDDCVVELVNAAFEGFNATILAYGQTGSGKTWTMGSASSSDMRLGSENFGIIPRVITSIFEIMEQKERDDPNSTYKVQVQFLEIYGETIRDLLDHTRTAKVTIRETATGEVFVSGAREEFVSSASQMMKALEDGSKHRTTASTLMNQSSSRSHEHTIHTAVSSNPTEHADDEAVDLSHTYRTDEESDVPNDRTDQKITHSKEVRRCKFHFVDLAGSERAKRTGAQGQQMKEGIDINKGLLALGNVISALGDESRKGKIHVPYRVSKLTRMLQDSLGGNSKTLMICCVSPSGINFYESLNALRYANRARNIQNKPVVNRDPTLVMIDQLKKLVHVLVTELIEVRKRSVIQSPEGQLSLSELEVLLVTGSTGSTVTSPKKPVPMHDGESSPKQKATRRNTAFDLVDAQRIMATTRSFSLPSSSTGQSSSSSSSPQGHSNSASHASTSNTSTPKRKESQKEITKLKSRASDADFELKRLTEQMKRAKQETSEMSERIILIQSERDFYHIKWSELSPENSLSFYKDPGSNIKTDVADKKEVTSMIAGYLREIESLKQQIAEKQNQSYQYGAHQMFDIGESELESELTTNVARVIAQTEKHLLLEAKRLKSIGVAVNMTVDPLSSHKVIAALDDGNDTDDSKDTAALASGESSPVGGASRENPFAESQIEEDDLAYQRRQKMMSTEVAELGESIDLKEQLLSQLKNSHYQYGVMKSFYEQKLTALNNEMDEKQSERDRLQYELQDLEHNTNKNEVEAVKMSQEQEKKLRIQLQKKDDELRSMKKRQEELTNLSRVQSRYTAQVAQLENDINGMRKQKVDLSKSLQVEKKRHYTLLNEKAREIDRLKRDLLASAGEAKRLGKDKQKAEERTREALKDSAAMRKKVHDAQRYGGTAESANCKARLARRAMGGAGKSSAARILSEDELRIKKWLDRRIADINSREEAADTLRKQCEQQLALLNKKEALELEKSSMEKSMRDVMTGSNQGERALSREEEEAIKEIEDRLESVDSQLKMRDRNISEIESKLASGDIAAAQESAIEALKRKSAVSLPASHELIRLLFDMLVATKSSSQQRKGSLTRSEARAKQLRHDLDDASRHMTSIMRSHDMELTRTANEYEEKLSGLFTHSTIGKLVRAESCMEASDPQAMDSNSPETTPSAKFKNSADASYKMLLSVASEQSNLLRSRLERESARTIELQSRISEVDLTCSGLQRDMEEKDVHIKFLEDERALFRDLADSLRAGISTLGGETGHTILKQIKDRVAGAVASDESDDETESMLGEYSNLGDIISRTGNVTEKRKQYLSDKNLSSLSSTAPASYFSSARDTVYDKDIVYDRLTNPSHFTGAMKSAFGDDELAEKRQKVKLIKSSNSLNNKREPVPGFAFARATHNKEHIAAYLDGQATALPSGCVTPDSFADSAGVPVRSSFLAIAKDSTINRSKLAGRTLTPPHSRLGGSQAAGPRVKSMAFVKSIIASMTLPEAEEPRRRSSSMTGVPSTELPRPPSIDVCVPPRATNMLDLDVEESSTVPETDAETSPIQSNHLGGMMQKLWTKEKIENDIVRNRRGSEDSMYSSVIDEIGVDKIPAPMSEKFVGPESEVEVENEIEKLIITIPSRYPSGDNTPTEKDEVIETRRIKALDAARAVEDCGFEDEENYYNVTSIGANADSSTPKTREEMHIMKIKTRLQSATAPVTPLTPKSPAPKTPSNVIKK